MPEEPFRLIHSGRCKNIRFRILSDGMLQVTAPVSVSTDAIQRIIIQNRHVIERLRQRTPIPVKPEFTEGSPFWLLGKQYPLHLTHRLKIFDNAFMVPCGSEAEIKTALVSLYRELAASIIKKRLAAFCTCSEYSPEKIRISSADTRWGSCSSAKTLSFSWKLIQCPTALVDYVIAHELSHLKEMNHSSRFWQLVGQMIPDYRERKKQLNSFAIQLPCWD